jgi:hypothetical protein
MSASLLAKAETVLAREIALRNASSLLPSHNKFLLVILSTLHH